MPHRTFAYCRVSTVEQTTENQVLAIRSAGYAVPNNRVVAEQVSGSVPAMQREGFRTLIDHKLEPGDTLIVLKLDRLGRDNIDVQQTIGTLGERGINVVSLDLPVADLASSEGKLMLQMFSAFAEFERNRIRERTQEGLNRAKAQGKAQGKKLGRPAATDTTEKVLQCKAEGLSQSLTAKQLGLGIATVKRHWNKQPSTTSMVSKIWPPQDS
ncbi:recombinase family protein [Photobacterium sp. ZSDE20]|uniref:Recombinase family protein n=1 Tax=Photobacterium pectinilyticum TaxID=2906793 RepID=A0ABT1N9V3_9GAMM|nr:recombinase family protein [Photobacterium sp. ZSDE20]MCQ1061337.1 recombinase family protein [Photobacterium sp. ZSDE20]MDD1829995.1 recombinase family protein [Photobacterium sp. ZSDE20]